MLENLQSTERLYSLFGVTSSQENIYDILLAGTDKIDLHSQVSAGPVVTASRFDTTAVAKGCTIRAGEQLRLDHGSPEEASL